MARASTKDILANLEDSTLKLGTFEGLDPPGVIPLDIARNINNQILGLNPSFDL